MENAPRKAGSRAAPCPGPDPGCADFTLPPWSDGAGFTDPSHYKTILTADIDGDGQVELLGRTSLGLEVWQMKPADATCAGPGTGCGRWEFVSVLGDLSDANGYDDPLWASTIHAARLYGNNSDQVFVWDPDGIVVYQWDVSKKQLVLTDLVKQFSSTSSDPGDHPRYLETLQASSWFAKDTDVVKGSLGLAMRDINNNGQITVAGYCGPATGFCKTVTLQGFDDDTRFGTGAYAWRTIRFGDIDNDGRPDVWGSDGIEIEWDKNDGATGDPQPIFMLPDGTDWGQPSHYLPMLMGNFYPGRGAGGIQILLRGSHTLHLIFWELVGNGQFTEAYPALENDAGTLLTDASLDPTEYSGTWQSLDINGDGQSEIIVRTPGGVRIFTLNLGLAPNMLSEITQPGFANTDRWAGDSRARTIRMVKNGADVLLLGRSAIGVQTGRWFAGTIQNPGHFEKISATFPQFNGADLIAFNSITSQLGLTATGLRAVYADPQASISTYLTLLVSVNNPGLNPVIWTRVLEQVRRELTWASFSAGLFAFNENITNESFLGTTFTAAAVVQRLQIGDARARAEDTREEKFVLSLVSDMSQFISLQAKGPNFINSVFDTAIGLIKTNPDNLPNAIAQFDQRLGQMFQESITHNSLAKTAVATDYGLLAEVGSLVQSGAWPTDGTTKLQMLAASQGSLELQLWKALTPSAWKIFACGEHSNNPWPNFDCDGGHAGAHTFGNGVRSWPVVDLSPFFVETDPNTSVVNKMFNTAPASCQTNWDIVNCGFGLDQAAVYRGQTDFHFSCITITGDDISGFGTQQFGAPCDRIGPPSRSRVTTPRHDPRKVKPRR
jgi:hypothetical protein